jgi:L-ascorbate metabolism protein UlaG (beta-lactamase superfamily)
MAGTADGINGSSSIESAASLTRPSKGDIMTALKGTRITWLGHATVLVQTAKGTNILIDPFIKQNPRYPKDFALPEKIQYILLTHGHDDHIADVVPVAAEHGSTVVAIYELANWVAAKGVEKTIGMNLGGTVQLAEVAATMVEAKHSSGTLDERGSHYLGVAAGFVLTIADGPVLYHSGDTALFGDMKLIGELYHPEIAMLPIGGHYTMGPKEAALAVRLLGAETILPLHFGTFPPLKGTPEQLAALVGGNVKIVRWAPGETV